MSIRASKDPHAGGTVVYRRTRGTLKLQILRGRIIKPGRQEGKFTICFASHLTDPIDKNLEETAERALKKEVLGDLTLGRARELGVFGPEVFPYKPALGYRGRVVEIKPSDRKAPIVLRTAVRVYAREYKSGIPLKSEEVENLEFVDPETIWKDWESLTLDQLHIFAELLTFLKHND
jgi:hypothetical protein